MNGGQVFVDALSAISSYMDESGTEFAFGEKDVGLFVHIFSKVDDPRVKGRVKYKLENLLTISMCLVLIGEFRSFSYAAAYVEENAADFEALGLIEGGAVPSHDAFRYLFMALDADSLRDSIIGKFGRLAERMLKKAGVDASKMKRLIIGDGKEFNGSGRGKGGESPTQNKNVFNVYDAGTGIVKSSTVIDGKSNEIPEAQRVLSKLNLKKCVVTMDALHCQTATCEAIRKRGGDYVLTVKGNQKGLLEEIDAKMARMAGEVRKGSLNGIDYEILTLPKTYDDCGFSGMRSFARVVSHKRGKRGEPCERSFISSLTDEAEIMATIDNRWGLENGPHRAKDELFFEDDYRFTDANAIKVMATMNNIAFSFFRIASAFMNTTVQRAKIRFRRDPIGIATSLIPMMTAKNFEAELKSHLKGVKKA